jgi:hypothetical protein
MATYNKFNQFVDDLAKGVHNFASHTFKVMLTNTAPVATNAVKADITEITAATVTQQGVLRLPWRPVLPVARKKSPQQT